MGSASISNRVETLVLTQLYQDRSYRFLISIMKRSYAKYGLFAIWIPLLVFVSLTPLRAQPLAFPGAEGFGRYALGGRGGQVLFVTNLNDQGPGSLRAAVDAEHPRMVVFNVAGTIELQSALRIRHPRITIAGQSAPGGGICLKNLIILRRKSMF